MKERDEASSPGGENWVTDRIEAGDTTCGGHMVLRGQNPDFENLAHSLTTYSASAADRDLRELVRDVEAPVYLTGAFQDEQTGPQFTSMVDDFDASALARITLWNGRHPDGYWPANLVRWFEFLELYVADRVPVMNPLVRAVLPARAGRPDEHRRRHAGAGPLRRRSATTWRAPAPPTRPSRRCGSCSRAGWARTSSARPAAPSTSGSTSGPRPTPRR